MSFFARFLRSARAQQTQGPFEAGVAAFDLDRYDEALHQFSLAVAAAATGAERAVAANKRALTFLRIGDRSQAVADFALAFTADERCLPAIVNVGNLLLEDGALDDAVVHYEAALRIDDAYAPAHLNLGIAFKQLGRRGDAVREFRRANQIEARLRMRRT